MSYNSPTRGVACWWRCTGPGLDIDQMIVDTMGQANAAHLAELTGELRDGAGGRGPHRALRHDNGQSGHARAAGSAEAQTGDRLQP